MKHILLILVALVTAGVGILILVESKAATTPAILSGSGFVLLGLAMAIPAKLHEAKGTLIDVARGVKDALTTIPPAPPAPPGGAS